MRAVNDYIVVDKIKQRDKKVSGLVLTEDLDTDNSFSRGKVITIGNLVNGIKSGDVVRYNRHTGHGIQWEDKIYYVIKVGDVVIVE
jgi:co-chaperonin GroES (HSP10)